ncbi:MAG: hypothetical protein HKO85_12040 [Xanthomonadales bacterium]|nr:hypothetical protein [Gammaproteobacteria bacterium]MBT8049884.1 hypothetical protein [Gammaproteobacteria bacterium]MBT8057099.1 hypothetical protein [Gammaproteobacteria bacterium]NNJ79368.1 hypothetical protein [Xanthomonadales bacterium]NNL06009.1 hypothetical protein [Xanthomonadales bacterium]
MKNGRKQHSGRNTGLRPAHAAFVLGLLLSFLAAACASNKVAESLSEAFKQYETIVRWSQWDAAADFIAPEYLVDNPITRLDMDRLRLFRVTAYTIRSTGIYDEGMTSRQTVEIKMFNKNKGVERTIIDDQEWRYNEESQRWLLHSGLPDPTQRY